MSFSDNLQYLRKREKITQEELAEELEVSRQSVSKWETGEAYPETDKLIALCDKFGVTMDGLLRGDVTCGAQPAQPVKSEESVKTEEFHQHGQHRKKQSFLSVLATAISSAIMLVCLTVYIILGATLNAWGTAWLVFLGGIVISIWCGSFTNPRNKTLKRRFCGAICGSSMLVATIVFFLLGFLWGLWHPGWVAFIAGAAVCSFVGVLLGKNRDADE